MENSIGGDAPVPLEGSRPYDRTILLSFPSRESFRRWLDSPEYQAIVPHRHSGTVSNVVVLDGVPAKAAAAH